MYLTGSSRLDPKNLIKPSLVVHSIIQALGRKK